MSRTHYIAIHAHQRLTTCLQVLNMKPPEVLGMLEEAAGTRMYENKKGNALKTLERKQIKVEEINKVGANTHVPDQPPC